MKIDRTKVYNKYNGHCAYCGKEIEIEDMQVDHIIPKIDNGTDDISNLNPSCRLCNLYKRSEPLEVWRNWELNEVINKLKKIYIFKVALAFGMIEIKSWDKKFYFEKLKQKNKQL